MLVLDYLIYKIAIKTNDSLYFLILGGIITLALSLFFISVIKDSSNNITYVTITNDGIKIKQPLKFRTHHYNWFEIKGYSKSDYMYSGKPFRTSKCIIIYTKNNLTFEIIDIYNSNFKEFQTHMCKFNVIYFGKEKFERGRFGKRKKYKFLDLNNI